jgi:RIO-like serine/threonine protein kinase
MSTPPTKSRRLHAPPPPSKKKQKINHLPVLNKETNKWTKKPRYEEQNGYNLLKEFLAKLKKDGVDNIPDVLNFPTQIEVENENVVKVITKNVGDVIKSLSEVEINRLKKGLQYLHERGYVHGDIRKQNICRDNKCGLVYIIDFGSFARVNGEVLENQTCYVDNLGDNGVTHTVQLENDQINKLSSNKDKETNFVDALENYILLKGLLT